MDFNNAVIARLLLAMNEEPLNNALVTDLMKITLNEEEFYWFESIYNDGGWADAYPSRGYQLYESLQGRGIPKEALKRLYEAYAMDVFKEDLTSAG